MALTELLSTTQSRPRESFTQTVFFRTRVTVPRFGRWTDPNSTVSPGFISCSIQLGDIAFAYPKVGPVSPTHTTLTRDGSSPGLAEPSIAG